VAELTIAFALEASPSVLPAQPAASFEQSTTSAIGSMVESGIAARRETAMFVEPTGVEPTGVEPTGVDPTGVDPTGADPIWPPTSAWRTVVAASTFEQLPPFAVSAAHHDGYGAGTGRLNRGVGPSNSDDQWTLLKRVVAKLTSFNSSAFRRDFAVGSEATSASVSAFSG
jgi:hypothetical protein